MMRIFQVKNSDSLKQLLKSADTATLERVKALNPHLDLASAKAGSTLLLPDSPAFRDANGPDSVAADAWEELSADASAGLKARAAQLKAGVAERDAQRKELATVLKSAAVRRQLNADPALRQQADAAEACLKTDQKAATDATKQIDAMAKALGDELATLAALFK